MKPRPVVVVCAALIAFLLLTAAAQVGNRPSHKVRTMDASMASWNGWHLTGWQFGTTTTTAPPPTTTTVVVHSQPKPQATTGSSHHSVVHGPVTGDFASCVRQKESSNNYAYSGYYHGAYNMTIQHWDGYGGYARPEDAPPSVQDAKFQDDVSHGSGYMHQQYPQTSRACGG